MSNVQRSHIPGVYRIFLDDPGTGWVESVVIGIPQVPYTEGPGKPPLLVMFHSFSVSELDCEKNSPIFHDALDRGWYVIAPLGANDSNFGIPYSQINVEYALDLFVPLLPVDTKRIYGLGFSMGGGGILSYAARHLDPKHTQFAAIINHTGNSSIANTFWNSTDTSTFEHPLLFDSTPLTNPFIYSQASVVDIDFSTDAVDPATDLARNLAHIPTLNQYAINDPILVLVSQTEVLHAWLGLIPGAQSFILTPNDDLHHWQTIDSNTALNFLRSKTLEIPTEGVHQLLADRDATWFHFDIKQQLEGAFTPLRWNMENFANRLTIDECENLQDITVNTQSVGLNTVVNLELVIESGDGTDETVTLMGYALQPQEVLRNGVTDLTWSWDSVTKTVSFTETPLGSPSTWLIRP